jgi:tRNA threonylcarbamoyladenosine biosynthesis protein TsaE
LRASTFLLIEKESTERFGQTLGALLRPGDMIALVGDLGAGKTTLTQAIARGMGITAPVTSPTFALIQEYLGSIPLFHFDTYRLERAEDLADLGFDEYTERGGVLVIEWADRIAPLLPPDRLTLRLKIEGPSPFPVSAASEVGEGEVSTLYNAGVPTLTPTPLPSREREDSPFPVGALLAAPANEVGKGAGRLGEPSRLLQAQASGTRSQGLLNELRLALSDLRTEEDTE